jgi:hypothetical protein
MRYASSSSDSSNPTPYSRPIWHPSNPLAGAHVEPGETEEAERDDDENQIDHEDPRGT